MHTISVVTAARKLSKGEKPPKQYVGVAEYSVEDIRRLLNWLRTQPHKALVLDAPISPDVRERNKETFPDRPKRWIALDIDSLEWPDPAVHDAAWVREQLPEPFRRARCVWHESSSAAAKPHQVKMHMFFTLDTGITHAQARKWLAGSCVDTAALSAARLMFTYGCGRARTLDGERYVRVPDLEQPEPRVATEIGPKTSELVITTAEIADTQRMAENVVAKMILRNDGSGYALANKIGLALAHSVAVESWNADDYVLVANRYAQQVGGQVAALDGTNNPIETYETRVFDGIMFALGAEREKIGSGAALRVRASTERALESAATRALDAARKLQSAKAAVLLAPFRACQGYSAAVDQVCAANPEVRVHLSSAEKEAPVRPVDAWRDGLEPLPKGDGYKATDANVARLIGQHPAIESLSYAVRGGGVSVAENEFGLAVGETNLDVIETRLLLWAQQWIPAVGATQLKRALAQRMLTLRQYDAFLDLVSVEPNSHTRLIDTWLTRFIGAEDTALNRAIGKLWLLGAVKRAYEPGAVFDEILVLNGPQGCGKTSTIRNLANVIERGYCAPTDLALRGMEESRWALICDLPEMTSMRKHDIAHAKAFASSTADQYRAAYAQHVSYYPRRFVLAASTNEHTFLSDVTGSRRFWAVTCARAELMAHEQAVQLWREAAALYRADPSQSLALPEELAAALAAVHEGRSEERYEYDLACAWLREQAPSTVTTRALFDVVAQDADWNRGRVIKSECVAALLDCGYEQYRQAGVRVWKR